MDEVFVLVLPPPPFLSFGISDVNPTGENRGSLAFKLCLGLHILAGLFDNGFPPGMQPAFAGLTLGEAVIFPVLESFIYNSRGLLSQ